jgi:hypothetical protein
VRVVRRHELDLAFAADQAQWFHKRAMESDVPRIPRFPERLHDLLGHAHGAMAYKCASDAEAAEIDTWESTTLAMQAGAGIFLAAREREGAVECRIGEETLAVPATGPVTWSNEGVWLEALWFTMVCRERERTDMLCAVPEDLLRASERGAIVPAYMPHWGRALRAWWRREPEHYDHLIEAVRAADPEAPGLSTGQSEHIAFQALPLMKMFRGIVENDQAIFNDSLAEALELHRTYWTADAERARRYASYVALGPLALTCLAAELGVTVDVRSEYLPEELVAGSWVGEFPT